MKAPARPSDISKEWLKHMLTDYEQRDCPGTIVTIDSYEISKGSKVGEGYVGSMIKLNVKATVAKPLNNIDPVSKIYDLAIKFKGDDHRIQFMFEKAQVYLKEELMYSQVLNYFDNFQKSRADNKYPISIPKYVYGKSLDDEFVLVMENIKDERFRMHKEEETFNYHHLKLAVTQLVRLHAISYSFNQSFPLLEKHPEFEISEYVRLFQKFFLPAMIDLACEIMIKEGDEDLAEKIKNKKDNLIRQYEEMLNVNKYKILCLIHGDAHSKNMMFKYSEDDQSLENPIGIKLLDWQISHWNTPILDLHYLISTSTSRELRKEHLEDILQFYHSTFIEATNDMGVKVINWSFEDFKNEFNSMALYGFIKGLHLSFIHHCPGFIAKSEEEKQSAINQPYILQILLKPVAWLFQYYFLSSTVDSIMNQAFKSSLLPFINEITTRENENLASRILGLIYEAEENGLFN